MTTFQKNKFFRSQLMPGVRGLGAAWFKPRDNRPARVSHKARREDMVSRKATCEQCGQVFKQGLRQRAKTCSRACHVAAMRKGGAKFDKAQRQCVPCLYALGFGASRIREALRIGSVGKHLARAGVVINHAKSCQVAARLGLNNKPSKEVKSARIERRKEDARLKDDMALLRKVIGEIRKELISRPEEVERRRIAASAKALARYHRTKPQGLRFKSAKAKTDEEKKRRALAYVKKWQVNNPDKWLAQKRKARKRRSKTFAAKQRNSIRRALKLRHASKMAKSSALWGCNSHFLKSWIESQFTKGMSWSNRSSWHVDHIVPCAAFRLDTIEGQRACFHYTNLRPLWAADNISKSDTIIACQPELLLDLNQ